MKISFIPESAFITEVFKEEYDVLVYSLLMDYTQNLYQFDDKIKIPYGGYDNKLENFKENTKFQFRNDFESLGQINEDDFIKNLVCLVSKVKKPIIFINGAEVNIVNNEVGSFERHKYLNSILDQFIKRHDNCFLLDMREIIKNDDQLIDNIRHYKRDVYESLANNLIELIKLVTKSSVEFTPKNAKIKFNKVKHTFKQKYASIRKKL